jgi:RNA polymerase sigma-70 factor (ECF subfamily)
MEDSEIIELFYARSEQAVIELASKYDGIFKKISYNILNNQLDADECVNDAYLGVWNAIPPHSPSPLVSFVCKIVRNLSIKRYHINTAVKRNSHYDVAFSEIEGCISSPDFIENEYDAVEFVQLIENVLNRLALTERVMFMRRFWFFDSLSEIANRFDITDHNAAVKLSRIRAKVRKYLIEEGYLT